MRPNGVALGNTVNTEAVGGRFSSNKRVRWPLVPIRACDWLVGVVLRASRKGNPLLREK